jgi:hypothetical protein
LYRPQLIKLKFHVNCPKEHCISRNQIEILNENARKVEIRNIYVRK